MPATDILDAVDLLGIKFSAVVNPTALQSDAMQTLLAKGRAGEETPVLVLGDSIPFGFGSRTTDGLMRMNGVGPQFARALSGIGVKASAQGFIGNGLLHGATTESALYDTRIAGATPWRSGVDSLGGRTFFAQFSVPDPLPSFTPSEPVTTIEIYWRRAAGGGTFSWAIDGGAATNVSTNGTAGLQKTTISGLTLGSHTVALASVSGDVRIYGFDGFDSSKVGLKFINSANNGGVLSDYTANTNDYDPRRVITDLAPSATIIGIGANHWNASLSLATFQADLQTLITHCQAFGPVMLISDPGTDPVASGYGVSLVTQKTYVDAMAALAISNDCVMFDVWTLFGGLTNTFGARYLADGIHPSQMGHGYYTSLPARALASA